MNLKEIRLKKGMSQVDVAKLLNIHIGTYINWERGVSRPNNENFEKLKDFLGKKYKE